MTNMLRHLRKILNMAKNVRQKGKSARNGNSPSPYTKYAKTPYKYSTKYHQWRSDRLAGRVIPKMEQEEARQYRIAAE